MGDCYVDCDLEKDHCVEENRNRQFLLRCDQYPSPHACKIRGTDAAGREVIVTMRWEG